MPEGFGCSERHYSSKVDTEKCQFGEVLGILLFSEVKMGHSPYPYKAQQTLVGSFAVTLSWLTDLGSK